MCKDVENSKDPVERWIFNSEHPIAETCKMRRNS
jgi:hypothetical protein